MQLTFWRALRSGYPKWCVDQVTKPQGRPLGDVRGLQFTRSQAVGFVVHQVIGGGNAVQVFHLRWPAQAAHAGSAHQDGHQALDDLAFYVGRRLGVNPA